MQHNHAAPVAAQAPPITAQTHLALAPALPAVCQLRGRRPVASAGLGAAPLRALPQLPAGLQLAKVGPEPGSQGVRPSRRGWLLGRSCRRTHSAAAARLLFILLFLLQPSRSRCCCGRGRCCCGCGRFIALHGARAGPVLRLRIGQLLLQRLALLDGRGVCAGVLGGRDPRRRA